MVNSGIEVFALVHQGRWIAECLEPCYNALLLEPAQTSWRCVAPDGEGCCYRSGTVIWPSNAQDIWTELNKRWAVSTRNWYPKDHPTAIRAGIEHGQSVDDLIAERLEHENGGTQL